jgi:subtilisin family serine protease
VKSLKTLPLLLLALVLPSPASASAAPEYAPGAVIVKFRTGVQAAERRDALRDHGASLERPLPVARTVVARIPASEDVGQAARVLERDPRVVRAEPDVYVHAAAVPNDPLFGTQWSMHNSGQTVQGTAGAVGADIHAPEAWERTTGSPAVKVAVVDGGINFGQPDLQPNIWHNPGESGGGRESNGLDDDGDGFADDWRGWDFVQGDNDPSDNLGHGTHVAGTIAARGDNGIGVAGVAWQASLIPVRVLDNVGAGVCSDLAAGMAYAVRQGARIVNMSLGSHLPCQAERDVIDGAPDVLFVVAALNAGLDVDADPIYPCAYPSANIVCVAATDSSDGLAGFSNYGARSVDLGAPGVSVISSYVKWGPKVSLFTDDIDSPLADRWVTGGSPDTWTRTPFAGARSGGFSLANSQLGDYPANSDNC